MKVVVTVYEETYQSAVRAIRAIENPHDMVEVRAERFSSIDLGAIRAATARPIILTYRTGGVMAPVDAGERGPLTWPGGPDVRDAALRAGIDFVDVEWHEGVSVELPDRTVISHHDYEGVRDVEEIMARMAALDCAYTKLAATPRTFSDNERLLQLLQTANGKLPAVIGMGERGLYSRILAPFRGSALTFVAAGNVAAPGQLTLARALEIYGTHPRQAERVFAVAGNPAGHSQSPAIHNRLFREKGVPAAYTIASVEHFRELEEAFLRGEPCGLSVTAPFKDDAFAFAAPFHVAENARRARAVNTLVNVNGRILADNTDVDGFAGLLPAASRAAILGAGATSRAALVALEDAGIPAVVYNRTASKGDASLEELRHFDGDLIINTLPAGVEVAIPRCRTYIEASYAGAPRAVQADLRIGGLELLHAQAVRQHQLFMKVFDGV
ncbi:MAG: type I 3-dehydroquinate dehydratase [Acidobacteriota bacterium]